MRRMIMVFAVGLLVFIISGRANAQAESRTYLWLEPEWFEGVEGSFAYWPGPDSAKKATGHWAVAGPGISAEWTQGGESEWNSMAAGADETRAECRRDIIIPRDGKYRVWVRYVDHRNLTEPFTIKIEQNGQAAISGELGVTPVVPPNDEYELYWGFSFGWGLVEGTLRKGPATLKLIVDKPGQAWRQLDAVLITDDPGYIPVGREKPPFAYFSAFGLEPAGDLLRGTGRGLKVGSSWQRKPLGGKDFSMWTQIDADKSWWSKQNLDTLTPYEVFFQNGCSADIKDAFLKQFAGRKDIPIVSWQNLFPGLYLGYTPDLSPDSPVRRWLEKTGMPFYILTNYANPAYNEQTGPALYAALTGPLAKQFLGYIHGEAVGTMGVSGLDKQFGKDRRQHIDEWGKALVKSQAEEWSKIYKTRVPEEHFAKSISCLSCESIALAHLFHELGATTVGYELDATNIHAPMRIAFERGAARQYGGNWINYASGNFGDACNYFTQDPVVPRGAKCWFHSKYAVTDGVSISWYRRFYYLNYLSGASAIFWEQALGNQWIMPGPGTHPVQLSPFGRATEDFHAFVNRLPDRGEPYTPVAFLLSYGHGFEPVNYTCKMLNFFQQNAADLEIRELFNVAWYPTAILEGQPQAPDVQSMPGGTYGNIFDVLVDRPGRARAIMNYPVVWAAGDVVLDEKWIPVLDEYLNNGGTLVLNSEAAKNNKALLRFLGVTFEGKSIDAESWSPDGNQFIASPPYRVEIVKLAGAKPVAFAAAGIPIITRNKIGQGALILTLVPHMLCMDERAHPALPFLMNGLTKDLLPVEVVLPGGKRPAGEIMYQINRTKNGWLVGIFNNRGIDKTQNGIARVDRRMSAEIIVRTKLEVSSAREYTVPSDLKVKKDGPYNLVRIEVPAGDVRVMDLIVR